MQEGFILILASIAGALASGITHAGNDYGQGQYAYNGHYGGRCGNDGFYFRDSTSFVICSNNNAYVQPCAPGTRNSGQDHYVQGGSYFYRDFCDVNLVDYGYGANFGGYGHGGHSGGHRGGYQGGHGGTFGHHGGYGGHGHTGQGYGYHDKSYGREYGYEKGYGHKAQRHGGYQGKQYHGGHSSHH